MKDTESLIGLVKKKSDPEKYKIEEKIPIKMLLLQKMTNYALNEVIVQVCQTKV